jgi:carboxyl-terminal processing protease
MASIGLAVSLTASFGAGVLSERAGFLPGAPGSEPEDAEPSFGVFWEAWRLARSEFVDRSTADPRKLTYGAISGMVDSLGDVGHSRFLSPDEAEQERRGLSGEFSGIGAEVGTRDGRTIIVAPMDGSPARQAGLVAGDVIVRVDGDETEGWTLTQLVNRVRGPAGTTVILLIYRPSDQSMRGVPIVRATIKLDSTSWRLLPGTSIAHVRVSQFAESTGERLATTLVSARSAGANAIILDIRNNPGGYLEEAVAVSSQFLSSGLVLVQQDGAGNRKEYQAKPGGVAADLPLVVLINEGSASAAEITAGAIQDHKRGTVVGQTTFGRGTVLSAFALSDGSQLLLGTAEWLTPSGRRIWRRGIEPDVKVELAPGRAPLAPSQSGAVASDELALSGDAQLLRGIEILSSGTGGR